MRKQLLVPHVLTLSALLAIGAALAYAAPGDKGGRAAEGDHKGKDKDSAKGEKAGGDDKDKDKDKDDKDGDKDKHGHDRGPHAMRELLDELGSGKVKKGDVKARLD